MSRPPRVLLVMGSSDGGVVRHVADIAAVLVREGGDVIVAAPAAARGRLIDSGAQLTTIEITDRPRWADRGVIRRLRSLARNADIVHAHGLRAGALTCMATRRIRLRHRPIVVVTEHNLPVGSWRIRAVSAVLERTVARRSDVVLGVSGDLVRRAISYGSRAAERALVPAPPSPAVTASRQEMRQRLGVPRGTALIVTVARLAPQKGLDLLTDTAVALRADGTRFRWLVIGEGPLRSSLAEQVAAHDLPVELLGRREDVADLMSAADVVVSTSVWEGQPLVVQEALSVGAAIVATDVGGTGEVTGEAAILVDYGDPFTHVRSPEAAGEMASAIRSVIDHPETANRLRHAARVRAEQLPSIDDVFRQLERVYREGAERR